MMAHPLQFPETEPYEIEFKGKHYCLFFVEGERRHFLGRYLSHRHALADVGNPRRMQTLFERLISSRHD